MAESMSVVVSSETLRGGVESVMTGTYDEQVTAIGRGSFEGYPYLIETADGQAFSGRLDRSARLPRVHTHAASDYTVYWGDEALARQGVV
ncbi:hypothetical protein [Paraburkholderia dilworthii]|uniref:hypothetical protein n=1 Tax=Paraburkholderia dilworthii TaxID=948106 RepID=UPI001FCCA727|nr:hypothetical protein [Paraburkholderia dilworthii]